MQLFTSAPIIVNQKHWKPFGCLVYVLTEALPSGKPQHKWKSCTQLSIYLGQSLVHNQMWHWSWKDTRDTSVHSSMYNLTQFLMLDASWQMNTHLTLPKNQPNNNDKHRCDNSERSTSLPTSSDTMMHTQ